MDVLHAEVLLCWPDAHQHSAIHRESPNAAMCSADRETRDYRIPTRYEFDDFHVPVRKSREDIFIASADPFSSHGHVEVLSVQVPVVEIRLDITAIQTRKREADAFFIALLLQAKGAIVRSLGIGGSCLRRVLRAARERQRDRKERCQ